MALGKENHRSGGAGSNKQRRGFGAVWYVGKSQLFSFSIEKIKSYFWVLTIKENVL